jgi:hypothetical protein
MPTQLDNYIEKQEELVKKYNGKIIALKDGEVKGVYETMTEGLRAMIPAGYEPGSFFVRLCTPGDEQYTAYYQSNVSFNNISLYEK